MSSAGPGKHSIAVNTSRERDMEASPSHHVAPALHTETNGDSSGFSDINAAVLILITV
jgi:hypothetical protein